MGNNILTNYARLFAFLGVNILAVLIFCFGLIGPLTPSEGMPSMFELSAFVGGPSLLLLYGFILADTKGVKAFVLFELILLLGSSAYLLWFLARH